MSNAIVFILISSPPFALSLSKGSPERSEGISLRSMTGFDFAQPERGGNIAYTRSMMMPVPMPAPTHR